MDLINHHRDGRVLVLEINRQSKKNGLTLAMFASQEDALLDAEADGAVQAIVLCGASDNFWAGHDLDEFDKWPQEGHEPVPRFLHTLAAVAKPLVIAVQGWGVGIGATALLHADWVVASGEARLRYRFVNLGIAPEAGCTLLLEQHVGALRAKQRLLSGEAIGANDAHSWCSSRSFAFRARCGRLPCTERKPWRRNRRARFKESRPSCPRPTSVLHEQIDREVRATNEAVVALRDNQQIFKKPL